MPLPEIRATSKRAINVSFGVRLSKLQTNSRYACDLRHNDAHMMSLHITYCYYIHLVTVALEMYFQGTVSKIPKSSVAPFTNMVEL